MAEENKEDNKNEQQKQNYERLLFAIAVLYAEELKLDISKVEDYSELSEGQKTFVKKIYKEHPSFEKQVLKDQRLSEQQIIKDTQTILKDDDKNLINGSRFAKWVSFGDSKVCNKCKKWENKIVCVSGNPQGFPTVDDVIKSGALHYGCRCALLDIDTDEIPLKKPNPRIDQRKQLRPDIYNSTPTEFLVFN